MLASLSIRATSAHQQISPTKASSQQVKMKMNASVSALNQRKPREDQRVFKRKFSNRRTSLTSIGSGSTTAGGQSLQKPSSSAQPNDVDGLYLNDGQRNVGGSLYNSNTRRNRKKGPLQKILAAFFKTTAAHFRHHHRDSLDIIREEIQNSNIPYRPRASHPSLCGYHDNGSEMDVNEEEKVEVGEVHVAGIEQQQQQKNMTTIYMERYMHR